MMETPALVPTRTAPALTMSSTSRSVRMPPDALTPMLLVEAVAQQLDVLDRGALRPDARGRLDEVHAGLLADLAGHPLHLGRQVAGLDDRLDDHLPAPGVDAVHAHRADDAGELVAHEAELAGEEGRHVDDHVDLVGAALHRLVGGERLGRAACRRRRGTR